MDTRSLKNEQLYGIVGGQDKPAQVKLTKTKKAKPKNKKK